MCPFPMLEDSKEHKLWGASFILRNALPWTALYKTYTLNSWSCPLTNLIAPGPFERIFLPAIKLHKTFNFFWRERRRYTSNKQAEKVEQNNDQKKNLPKAFWHIRRTYMKHKYPFSLRLRQLLKRHAIKIFNHTNPNIKPLI